MSIKVMSLNINGLNELVKQQLLDNLIRYHKIDVMMIQEHNIKDESRKSFLTERYVVIMNNATNLKGGTCILINKGLDSRINAVEKSADSRITSVKCDIHGNFFHFLNVYAFSGNTMSNMRDDFFDQDLLYYLRGNTSNTIMGGDWNCVLSPRDVSNDNGSLVSKSLLRVVRDLRFNDVWHVHHRDIEYTYVRANYGSRIDRIYTRRKEDVVGSDVVAVSFSDHSGVVVKINVNSKIRTSKPFWKLNVQLLKDEDTVKCFKPHWQSMKMKRGEYDNINDWWDNYAKKEIKRFFVSESVRVSREKFGLLKYLESKLRLLYINLNETGIINYQVVNDLKQRINALKCEYLDGVAIRARIDERVLGESPSSYLLGREITNAQKKLMSKLRAEKDIIRGLDENVVLDTTDAIEMYVKNYYEKLYDKGSVSLDDQEYFLNLIPERVSSSDNDLLTEAFGEDEIYAAIKSMKNNKSPGIDGIPFEFYKVFWNTIKNEMVMIMKGIITNNTLSNSQQMGLITLFAKDGDNELLANWRPISLLCTSLSRFGQETKVCDA